MLALGDWHKVDPVYLSLGATLEIGFQRADVFSDFLIFETTGSVLFMRL